MESSRPPSLFCAYRDSPERRAALSEPPHGLSRYRLHGLDEFTRRGARVRHNLEREGRPAGWARAADNVVNSFLYKAGGYGGDFVSVLPSLREINAAEVVFSTVDTVGIPLVLLQRARLVRPPIVYIAIGLPERLVQLRGARMQGLYAGALRKTRAIISYAASEAQWLRDWLGPSGPPVHFIPFGVDVEAFRPDPERIPNVDVVSIGEDPRRDFELLATVGSRRPELRIRIVAGGANARRLGELPPNVEVETDITLEDVRDRLAGARVVVLPVRENSYSGATTVLLQAMAMAKPVIVSRTEAIAKGYGLEDGVNCRLVEPGNAGALERAVVETTTGAEDAVSLGIRARETVERSLSWERHTDALWRVLSGS